MKFLQAAAMAPETKLLLVVTRGAFDACPGRHTSAPRGSFWITAVALFSDQLWGWAVNFVEKTKGYDQQMDAYKCLSVCMPVSVGFDKHLYIYIYMPNNGLLVKIHWLA